MVQEEECMTGTAAMQPGEIYEKKKSRNEEFYKFLGKGFVPEFILRLGIRRMLSQTIESKAAGTAETEISRRLEFVEDLKSRPIAVKTSEANEQHYEVPTEFFKLVLGPHMKYSSALWSENLEPKWQNLGKAEEDMLALTCRRAQLGPGQKLLELGCGWGSLSLYIAEKFPDCTLLSLSNSRTQREYIESEAAKRGLTNIKVTTCNIENFEAQEKFDRVLSVEMFEHLKNYDLLLERIASWLNPQGKLFVHIFTHKSLQYHYEDSDGSDWLTRHFFEGGMMPSDPLMLYFQRSLQIKDHWRVKGVNYQKTAEAWLQNMSRHKQEIMPVLASTYGAAEAKCWWVYWRLFFLSCAELWGYQKGEEWMLSHYLFEKP